MTSLLGHERQVSDILKAAASGRMHHGWLLAGPKGVGKASFARAIALRLLADAAGPPSMFPGLDVSEDHPVAHLFRAGTHPDYAELTRLEKDSGDLARNITVDQVRALQRLLNNAPSMSHRRIILIDSADDLERGAANALLKNLEEPPAGTIFLLVSHAPSRLLPTIRSRCRMLRFGPLAPDRTRSVLQSHLPEEKPDEIEALVRISEGAPGRALRFAGLGIASIEQALKEIAQDGDPGNGKRLALARSLSGKPARARYEAFLERVPSFLAEAARERRGPALQQAIAAWERSRQISSGALILALDPAAVAFELTTCVATLAQDRMNPEKEP